MLKTLASQVKEYKKASIITPIFVTFEVIMELLIPLLMSTLIDNGISTGNMKHVFIVGGVMVVIAGLSLLFGVLSGKSAALASTGFAKNLRKSMRHMRLYLIHKSVQDMINMALMTLLPDSVVQAHLALVVLALVDLRILLIPSLVVEEEPQMDLTRVRM